MSGLRAAPDEGDIPNGLAVRDVAGTTTSAARDVTGTDPPMQCTSIGKSINQTN